MNLKKSHILFIFPVLFTWLSISEASGVPRLKSSQQQGFSWKDTRLNVDFSWGTMPVGKFYQLIDLNFPFDTHYNYSVKVLGGYSFPVSEDRRWGFETGLGYNFARVIERKEHESTFAEDYLTVPLLLTFFKPLQASFYCAHTNIIGYEFDIILSSTYKQSGYYHGLQPSLQGDKDVIESLPDFSRFSGKIIVVDRFDFPKGIYAAISVRLPIDMFLAIKEMEESDFGLNMAYVRIMRWFSANLIELTVGVNIVDWIYPQEKYQRKPSWRKR